MARQDEETEWREALQVFFPQLSFVPRPFPQSWIEFQTAVAKLMTIAIPNSIIRQKQSDQVYCEAYRIAYRYHLPALQQLFTIQGENAVILCRNSSSISFSKFYSHLQQLNRVQLLLEDPSGNWQELLRYVFSEGVKEHFRLNKGNVDYNPQILINLLAYLKRTEKTPFHLESFLAFWTELPQSMELHQLISHTLPFADYVVLAVNNRCQLIDSNFHPLPYHEQATEVYSMNKSKKQFALNCISVTYFFQAEEYPSKRLQIIHRIQNVYLLRNWIIIKGINAEGSFQLIERAQDSPPLNAVQQPNYQPVEVSPMKVRGLSKDIKQQHRIFQSLFQDADLHAKFQLMMQALGNMDEEDMYWPFVQQGLKFSFQYFVCSIFICYNLILKKAGIQKIKQIFNLNLYNQTLTCYFKRYNPKENSFEFAPIVLRIQDYFNVHTKDLSLAAIHQIDMRILWNFVQKRMIIEGVKYFLGGEKAGLDIRSIFGLLIGREHTSFMVRVKSIKNPDVKKGIIDSFLANYHFDENPESLFRLFSIHRNNHVGMFVDARQWQFPEKEWSQDIDCKTLPSRFDVIAHNINQTSQCKLLNQHAQNFRTQIQKKYPKMKVSKIDFQENSCYNTVLYIN